MKYLTAERFASYAYQLKEVLASNPRTVLEIGIGNGIVSTLLRKAGVEVTTLDIDASLGPDIIGSVTEIPVEPDKFDVVACFEVLEHLPFEMCTVALKEIRRVARKRAIISVPDVGRYIQIRIHLPRLGNRNVLWQLPYIFPKDLKTHSSHLWEIGRKGFPFGRLARCIEAAGLRILKTYRITENPYHRIFRLDVNKGE